MLRCGSPLFQENPLEACRGLWKALGATSPNWWQPMAASGISTRSNSSSSSSPAPAPADTSRCRYQTTASPTTKVPSTYLLTYLAIAASNRQHWRASMLRPTLEGMYCITAATVHSHAFAFPSSSSPFAAETSGMMHDVTAT